MPLMMSKKKPQMTSAALAPTSTEYIKALELAIKTNGGKKPNIISVDAQSAVARLQHVLAAAGIRAGYYPPPSDEELLAMGGEAANGVNYRTSRSG